MDTAGDDGKCYRGMLSFRFFFICLMVERSSIWSDSAMRPQSWLWLRINHFLQLQSESVQREQCRHSAATQKQSNNRNPIDPFNVCPYLGPIWRKRCERCHKNVFEIKKTAQFNLAPHSRDLRMEWHVGARLRHKNCIPIILNVCHIKVFAPKNHPPPESTSHTAIRMTAILCRCADVRQWRKVITETSTMHKIPSSSTCVALCARGRRHQDEGRLRFDCTPRRINIMKYEKYARKHREHREGKAVPVCAWPIAKDGTVHRFFPPDIHMARTIEHAAQHHTIMATTPAIYGSYMCSMLMLWWLIWTL